jgi:hypothetical protein
MFLNSVLLMLGSLVALTAVAWSLRPVRLSNPFYV